MRYKIYSILMYYLAFLICIVTILMFISIIFLSIAVYLRDTYAWWNDPFSKADYVTYRKG